MSNSALRASLVAAWDYREASGDLTDWVASLAAAMADGTYAQAGIGLTKSITLDGSTGRANIADNAALQFESGSFTIMVSAASSQTCMLLQFAVDSNGKRVQMYIDSNGIQVSANDGTTGYTPAQDATSDIDGVQRVFWVVVDRDANVIKAYRNAAQVGSSVSIVGAGTFNGGTFNGIGYRRQTASLWQAGKCGPVNVWKRAFSSADITEVINGGSLLPLRTPTISSITPNSGARGGVVTITAMAGNHYAGNAKTSILLRKSGETDVTGTFTPSSITAGTGSITLAADMAVGVWTAFVVVNGEEAASGVNFTVAALPIVTSITPATHSNSGTLTVTDLAGSYFTGTTMVRLQKAGQDDVFSTTKTVVSDTQITCTFVVTGIALGLWTVEVTNGAGAGSLTDGLEITQAPTAGSPGSAGLLRGVL